MRIFAFAAAAALLATTVAVHADPIAERKDLMRERGQILRTLAPVAQGQQPFDAATVLAALEQLHTNAERAADLDAVWPESSQSGDTRASPRIWQDRAAFQAASDQFEAAVTAAIAAAPQDAQAYQPLFSPIAASCGTCHESFRQ